MDASEGSRIPEHLQSLQFLKLVKRRLGRANGGFLANVYIHHDFDLIADRMLHVVRTIWHETALHNAGGPSSRNSFVLAGVIGNVELPKLMFRPALQSDMIELEVSSLTVREGRLGGLYFPVGKIRGFVTLQDNDPA